MMRMKLSTSMNLSSSPSGPTMVMANSPKINDNDINSHDPKSDSPTETVKNTSTTPTSPAAAAAPAAPAAAPRLNRAVRSFSSCPLSRQQQQTITSSLSSSPPQLSLALKSSSLDLQTQPQQQQPTNELIIIDQNQAIAIEVPPNTLKIGLHPFRPAHEIRAEPGDIIEFDRTLYSQWGIYVGDGDVVIVISANDAIQTVPDTEIAHVKRVPLITAAGDQYCRVNNKLLRAKERNLLPFNNEIVVRKALSKVGTTVPYNVIQCNTEHYVTEWKYGQRWSDQSQVSLNSFKALRLQHANSITNSHNVYVNTLNEVLNSPAVAHAGNQNNNPLSSPTSTTLSSSALTPTTTTTLSFGKSSKPIQIIKDNHQTNRNRSMSGGSSLSSSLGACNCIVFSSNSPPIINFITSKINPQQQHSSRTNHNHNQSLSSSPLSSSPSSLPTTSQMNRQSKNDNCCNELSFY